MVFSRHEKPFIFSENIGKFATNKRLKSTTNATNNHGLAMNNSENENANPAQKIAFAGVGNPIKEDVCRSSKLKIAKRNAEKMGIRNAAKHTYSFMPLADKSENTIAPGATPKLTTSANESNSFPNGEYAFKARAAKPSKKSKTPEINIANIAPV